MVRRPSAAGARDYSSRVGGVNPPFVARPPFSVKRPARSGCAGALVAVIASSATTCNATGKDTAQPLDLRSEVGPASPGCGTTGSPGTSWLLRHAEV